MDTFTRVPFRRHLSALMVFTMLVQISGAYIASFNIVSAQTVAQATMTYDSRYVRVGNASDVAAQVVTDTTVDMVRMDVIGVSDPTFSEQYTTVEVSPNRWRLATALLPAGEYNVTAEYTTDPYRDPTAVWSAVEGTQSLYVLDTPWFNYVTPERDAFYRPTDNFARVRIDDEFNQFESMTFTVLDRHRNETDYTVNRESCDLRQAGNYVICDIQDAENPPVLVDGLYQVKLQSDTLANNGVRHHHEGARSELFGIDSVAPVIDSFSVVNRELYMNGDIEVIAEVNDNFGLLNIANVEFYITAPRLDGMCTGNPEQGMGRMSLVTVNGNGTSTYGANIDSVPLSGSYCVNAIAEDRAGNHSAIARTSINLDNEMPVVTLALDDADQFITPDNQGGYITNNMPELGFDFTVEMSDQVTTVTASEVEVAKFDTTTMTCDAFEITVDSVTSPEGSTWGGNFNSTDATYCLRASATDAAGNVTYSNVIEDVTIDTVAPVVNIESPVDGKSVSGEVEIVASVQDLNPRRYYLVVLDQYGRVVDGPGTVYRYDAFASEVIMTLDTKALNNGTYTIRLAARDLAGNRDNASGSMVEITINVANEGVLQGRVYHDTNFNEVHDGDETEDFMDGWTVNVYDADWSLVDSQVTGSSAGEGQFRFENVAYGDYYVCSENQYPDAWFNVGPALGAGTTGSGFGYHSDVVAVENNSTNPSEESNNCWSVMVDENDTYGWLQFGYYRSINIGGYKFHDADKDSLDYEEGEETLPGWEITLTHLVENDDAGDYDITEYSDTTDEYGMYYFEDLRPGYNSIYEVQQAGWVQTYPMPYGGEISPENEYGYIVYIYEDYQFFGLEYGSNEMEGVDTPVEGFANFGNYQVLGQISGFKWSDADRDGNPDTGEDRLGGWVITLDQLDGGYSATDVTDSSGDYEFENVPAGTYEVCEVQQSGWEQIYPGSVNGCTLVEISYGSASANANFGNYQIPDDEEGEGNVNPPAPTPTPNPVFIPAGNQPVETEEEAVNESEEVLGEEDEVCEVSHELSGRVYLDENSNGKYDDGEEVYEDVKITVYGDEDKYRLVTDEDGLWEITLCEGTYEVEIDNSDMGDTIELDTDVKSEVDVDEDVEFDFVYRTVDDDSSFLANWWWLILVGLLLLAGSGAFFIYRATSDENNQ